MASIKNILHNIFQRPQMIPAHAIESGLHLSEKDVELLKAIGITYNELLQSVNDTLAINYDRCSIYRELERSQTHWLMSSALDLYADYSTPYSQMNGATVWPVSKDLAYKKILQKFLEEIEIEEKIYDWAWSIAGFGDLMVEVNGHPGLGVLSVNDSLHPSAISRLDHDGILLGFFKTPFEGGGLQMVASENENELQPPWKYVHFRLLGAIKRRPAYGDPVYQEFRTIYMLGAQTKMVSSKYGTSVLFNGLPVYKRLRMAEDAILLARLTRGIMKYIYKIRVEPGNPQAAGQIVREYMNILKHARAIDTSRTDTSANFESKSNPMTSVEDLFVPVYGDAGDIQIEKIGGEVDIKWIVDVEELRNQLACSIRVPLSLLGGYIQEASGQLGSEAISKLDIRFARSSRRIQRAICTGIKRLCQIHLAYLGRDPDPRLFDIQMGETSTEEEEIFRNSLDTSADAISKFMGIVNELGVNIDKIKAFEYFNKKILKMNDFDLSAFIVSDGEKEKKEEEENERGENGIVFHEGIRREFYTYLPLNEKNVHGEFSSLNENQWKALCKNVKIKVEKVSQ